MTQEKTARINELARLSHERVLTKEKEERKLLRPAHMKDFKEGARPTPDNTLVEYLRWHMHHAGEIGQEPGQEHRSEWGGLIPAVEA